MSVFLKYLTLYTMHYLHEDTYILSTEPWLQVLWAEFWTPLPPQGTLDR